MEQVIKRTGWKDEEINRLWAEIRRAAEDGEPLRSVFERMGQELNRKPNSVRNFYYMQLRTGREDACRRAAPFETFSQEEICLLIREVLSARARGESVRACVMRMAQGDKSRMLRLQNKYRSVLCKHPEWVRETARDMGLADVEALLPAPREVSQAAFLPPQPHDPDADMLYTAVNNLLRRARENDPRGDRARAQRDVCLMRLEEMQQCARELVDVCKEVCALDAPDGACAELQKRLVHSLSRTENLCASILH